MDRPKGIKFLTQVKIFRFLLQHKDQLWIRPATAAWRERGIFFVEYGSRIAKPVQRYE